VELFGNRRGTTLGEPPPCVGIPMRHGDRVKSVLMNLQKKSDTPFVRRRLFRPLACVLGAVFLIASPARASTTIGYDPFIDGNIGIDFELSNVAIYVPFVFNLGGPYTLDSIQAPFIDGYPADFFFGITPTLGTDLSLPAEFTPLSVAATSPLADSEAMVFTFSLDSPAVFTSGVTYYLRMAYVGDEAPKWVSQEAQYGEGSASGGDPSTSGGESSGGPPGGITLTPLMTLTAGRLAFRQVSDVYTDREGFYQLSITAHAVPEPTSFAMIVGGLTLSAALLFRLRRRR